VVGTTTTAGVVLGGAGAGEDQLRQGQCLNCYAVSGNLRGIANCARAVGDSQNGRRCDGISHTVMDNLRWRRAYSGEGAHDSGGPAHIGRRGVFW